MPFARISRKYGGILNMNPTVACLMLTKNRPELASKAVECFRRQSYPLDRRVLLILDTGDDPRWHSMAPGETDQTSPIQWHQPGLNATGEPIGALRNVVATYSLPFRPDILIHWDDDDWSHPERIAEQVMFLQTSGADCVGYDEMLFWRLSSWEQMRTNSEPRVDSVWDQNPTDGEAWKYSGTPLGTSLCYRRRTWQDQPFPLTSYGEDTQWLNSLRAAGKKISSVSSLRVPEPRMVARIHGGNTGTGYSRESMLAAPQHWGRVPEWDEFCKGVCG
jgi:glycosyltransferase involved in cell wall biosynthesis